MTPAWAIARREYAAFFRLPVGWLTIALYLFLTGLIFSLLVLRPGEPASLRAFFAASGWLLLPVAPAVSMRLLSDEFRAGTAEPLMTSPVSDLALVLGKFAGGACFLLTLFVPTLVYPLTLWLVADPAPDPGPVLAGYLSLGLVSLLYLALGTFISTLTSSQMLAFLGTLFALLILLTVSTLAAERAPWPFNHALFALSISRRLGDFARGEISAAHVLFFLAWSGWLVVLGVLALEGRRWR